jgi:hypothetical protein
MGAEAKIELLNRRLAAAKEYIEVLQKQYRTIQEEAWDLLYSLGRSNELYFKLREHFLGVMVNEINWMWGDSYNEWIGEDDRWDMGEHDIGK